MMGDEQIATWVGDRGYWVLSVVLVFETIPFAGIVFPGVVVLVAAGYLAGLGYLDIWNVLLASLVGVLIGDNIGYWLGYRFGDRVEMPSRFRSEYVRLEEWVAGRPVRQLVVFQFPVYSRVLVPFLLGRMRFSVNRWIKVDVLASVLFVTVYSLVGFIVGLSTGELKNATRQARELQIGSTLLVSFLLLAVILRRHYRKH